MKTVRIQWLTQDHGLWEVDWLRYLISDIQEYIDVEFEWQKIKVDQNTVLVCNHAVPYRKVLDNLRQNGKKYAIILLSDENLIDPCEWLHDPNCVGLMRNYVSPNLLHNPKVKVFGLGYKIGLVKNLHKDKKRDLTWSFAGTLHGGRETAIELFKELEPHSVHTCSGFGASDGLSTQDYAELLSRSKYVLCPPGQDSMDSFRTYEALEAGCVPVCIKNTGQWHLHPTYWHGVFKDYDEMPFICENTWTECLEKIKFIESKKQYEKKQKQCEYFWEAQKNKWKKELADLISKL